MKLTRTFAGLGSGLLVGTATLVLGTGVAQAGQGGEHGGGNDAAHNKVTICHATGSTKHPYVVITPDAAGVANGHYSHQDDRDIIPPFTFGDMAFPGKNWNSAGQAAYHNGCKPLGNEVPPVVAPPSDNGDKGDKDHPGTHEGDRGDKDKDKGDKDCPDKDKGDHGDKGDKGDHGGKPPVVTPPVVGTPAPVVTPPVVGTPAPVVTTPVSTSVQVATAVTPKSASPATTSTVQTGSTHVVPSSSTHAGSYDAGWNGAQWGGAGLAAVGALAGLATAVRRRLVRE